MVKDTKQTFSLKELSLFEPLQNHLIILRQLLLWEKGELEPECFTADGERVSPVTLGHYALTIPWIVYYSITHALYIHIAYSLPTVFFQHLSVEMPCGEGVLGVLTALCQARPAHGDKTAVSSWPGVCLLQAGHPTVLHCLPLITSMLGPQLSTGEETP